VGFVRARGGYVSENSGGTLPDYEKFYLGGINTLRGFDWQDIHLVDEQGNIKGGNKFVQFNFEFLFPLVKDQGFVGVIFYDTGQVYDSGESVDLGNLRESAGAGIRWFSPIGPIRVEYGYILDPVPGYGEGGQFEFAMGGAF
jgi:outer membrane protein insertion porin family